MTGPAALIAGRPTPFALSLRFGDVPLRVLADDADVWAGLDRYWAPWVVAEAEAPSAVVSLVQGPVDAGDDFVDLVRSDGRKVKEAVREVPGGRLILKRTTGVVMGLWPGGAFAAGDVRAHLNQAINLVNACYAKAMLRRGHLLLHAAGVLWAGRVALLAGPPGAGKSTSAVHLVEAGFKFLSNDRVLARPCPAGVEALGYPKQPRVNPGTLLHHPRLQALLEPEDRAALAALPTAALHALERKSDVDLEAVYGPGTVELAGEMRALVLLRWRFDGAGVNVQRLAPAEALAHLPHYYKNLGAFDLDRPPRTPAAPEERHRYAELLERVTAVEVTGGADFDALADVVGDLLER
jgi:HprK-related kinase B